jgi:hypothetical protein
LGEFTSKDPAGIVLSQDTPSFSPRGRVTDDAVAFRSRPNWSVANGALSFWKALGEVSSRALSFAATSAHISRLLRQ